MNIRVHANILNDIQKKYAFPFTKMNTFLTLMTISLAQMYFLFPLMKDKRCSENAFLFVFLINSVSAV